MVISPEENYLIVWQLFEQDSPGNAIGCHCSAVELLKSLMAARTLPIFPADVRLITKVTTL